MRQAAQWDAQKSQKLLYFVSLKMNHLVHSDSVPHSMCVGIENPSSVKLHVLKGTRDIVQKIESGMIDQINRILIQYQPICPRLNEFDVMCI